MRIVSKVIINSIIFFILFSSALFLQIVPGLYLYDLSIIILFLVLFYRGNIFLNSGQKRFLLMLWVLLGLPIFLSVFVKGIFSGGDLNGTSGINNYYYIWNIFLVTIYIITFYHFRHYISNIKNEYFLF